MKQWIGSGMLLLTAVIWGIAFVAQSVGMEYVEPFTFNFARYMIGAVVLLPFLKLGNPKIKENGESSVNRTQVVKKSVISGIGCGILLSVASMLQQFGIMYTDVVGKAGFITALYIILVPVLGIFLRKKTKALVWLCVVISVIGLYLLCVSDGYRLELADILLLACALFFAIHIIFIDYISLYNF